MLRPSQNDVYFIFLFGLSILNQWILPVQCPLGWIAKNVFPDFVEFILIPNHMFIVITLPNGGTGCVADSIDVFG